MAMYDYRLSLTSGLRKSVLHSLYYNCLMLKRLMHEYHFKTCYISCAFQQSAPRIPPSSARGSIDHFRSALWIINSESVLPI